MGFKLEKVIPWGRSMQEYVRMFDLAADELKLSILDCAGGPASFNVEMTRQGYKVVSCDPVYQFTASEISQRIQDTYLKCRKKAGVVPSGQRPDELRPINKLSVSNPRN